MDLYGRPSSLSIEDDREIRPGLKGDSDFDVAMRYCEHHPLAPMRILADALENAPDAQRIPEWPQYLQWFDCDERTGDVRSIHAPLHPAESESITVLQFFTTENTDCWFGHRFWRHAQLVCREYPAVRFVRILAEKYEAVREKLTRERTEQRLNERLGERPPMPSKRSLHSTLERERLDGVVAVDSERLDFFRTVGAIGWPFCVVLAPTGTLVAKWYQGSLCGGLALDENNGHVFLLDIILAGAMDYYATQLRFGLHPGQFSLLNDPQRPPVFPEEPPKPIGHQLVPRSPKKQAQEMLDKSEALRLRYPSKVIVFRRVEPLASAVRSPDSGQHHSLCDIDDSTVTSRTYMVIADTNNDRVVWCLLDESGAIPKLDLRHNGTVEGLRRPRGICYDHTHDLVYLADTENHRICRFRVPQFAMPNPGTPYPVEWIAGTGAAKFDLFGTRRARHQSLVFPWDVAVGPRFRFTPTAPLDEANSAAPLGSPDRSPASHAVYVTNAGLNQLWQIDFFAKQTAPDTMHPEPRSCRAVCGSGDHRQLDITSADNERLRIEPKRSCCFVSSMAQPTGLALIPESCAGDGDTKGPFIAFIDAESSSVRYFAPRSRSLCTLAGGGSATGDIDDLFEYGYLDHASGKNARFQHPLGITYDSSRRALFVADTYNNCIRCVDWSTGAVDTVHLVPADPAATELLVDMDQRGKVTQDDAIPFCLNEPTGVEADPEAFQGRGALWIADTNAHRILCVEWLPSASSEDSKESMDDEQLAQKQTPKQRGDQRQRLKLSRVTLWGRVHVVWDDALLEQAAHLGQRARAGIVEAQPRT